MVAMSGLPEMTRTSRGKGRIVLDRVASALWYVPGSFALARLLGPRYPLRCVLFHDIADRESAFTNGLGVTITRRAFEAALKFLTRYYTPVSLQDVIAGTDGRGLPARPVLVTFDDAYASVGEFGAALCFQYGVPAVFFVNGACLDNRQLALDNLICYVANIRGLGAVKSAAIAAVGRDDFELCSLKQVFSRLLPTMSLSAKAAFRRALTAATKRDERDLAAEAGLHISTQQLCSLKTFNIEIGNHTYSHTHCRSLSLGDFAHEVDRNKAILETISGSRVRSFSVPYGSSADLTAELTTHLHQTGHEVIFLAESSAGSFRSCASILDRTSINTGADAALFSKVEVLPRLRTIRKGLGFVSGGGRHEKKSKVISECPVSERTFSDEVADSDEVHI